MKAITYYLSRADKKNTSVVILKEGDAVARGVAICSIKDNFNKKLGRSIAMGRAIKAMLTQDSCKNNAIRRAMVAKEVPAEFKNKCSFMPQLTEYEEKLMAN